MISEKDYETLVKRFSGAFYRKMLRSGVTAFTLEDIQQEHWLGFCRARNSYSAETGVPFQAYLIKGLEQLQSEMRRKVSKRFHERNHLSLDAPIGDEDSKMQLHETLAGDEEELGSSLDRDQQIERLCANLSDRARTYVQLIYRQPAELLEQTKAIRARAEHASNIGIAHFAPSGVSSSLVFKLMGAPRQERTRINAEIEKALGQLARG
jgi:DNA-directed RNA polymerase specialized sigma24 family protein